MEWTPLSPRARLLFYLQAFSRLVLFWVPVTIAGSAAASFAVSPLVAGAGGVAWLFLNFLAALWIPSLAFDRWAYALRDEDLLIARGVLVRAITAIPVNRIQHVDTRQGPIEQWLGLARVQIHTASGVGADGVIPGLRLEQAEALRDKLVRVSGDGGV
jgi:membrane protein YdbS with pleckstrin-like domain